MRAGVRPRGPSAPSRWALASRAHSPHEDSHSAGPSQRGRSRLGPGDLLVLSTDGLTEGRGRGGEEFGDHRVSGVLAGLDDPTPSAAVSALCTAAERFAVDRARDDVSLLAAAPAPEPAPAAAGGELAAAAHPAKP
ncbi:SpoIIE family protein phosphatase [Streptomyces sp. NPDC093094]|uniref:SpoIIE family protein phosphatase n=1 Tax=Streptomyces sp. NPDC093094 TaxID=3366026 RepID=UPI0037F437AD